MFFESVSFDTIDFWVAMMQKKNVDFDDDGAARTAEGRVFDPATPLLQPLDYRII